MEWTQAAGQPLRVLTGQAPTGSIVRTDMEPTIAPTIGNDSSLSAGGGFFARSPMRAFGALIAVNAMWAFQFAGARLATEELGPVLVTLVPMAIATILVAPFAGLTGEILHRRNRRDLLDIMLLGTLGVLPAQLCVVLGVERTLASNASVLALTVPVLTALCASAFLDERMTVLRWLSFAIAIAGACMVSAQDIRNARLFQMEYVAGNLLVLASCAGSAFNNSYSRRVLSHFSPSQVLVWTFVVADVELLLIEAATDRSGWRQLVHLTSSVWWSLVLIAVFSLGVSMLLYFSVIQAVEVIKAAVSVYLLPLFGLLFSALLLKERLTVNLVAGGALIFVSCFLVTVYEERQRMRREAPNGGV